VRNLTVQDFRRNKYCVAGIKKWFAHHDRGMTFSEFLNNGASAEWLRSQDDAMVTMIVDKVETDGQ
jgi:hypothetical protein